MPVVPVRYHDGMALTLRTDEELEKALDGLTGAERLSRQEVIRRAVLERWARVEHRARVHAAVREGLDEWHEALDSLGKA